MSSDPAVIVHLSALGSCNFELLWLCRQRPLPTSSGNCTAEEQCGVELGSVCGFRWVHVWHLALCTSERRAAQGLSLHLTGEGKPDFSVVQEISRSQMCIF